MTIIFSFPLYLILNESGKNFHKSPYGFPLRCESNSLCPIDLRWVAPKH